MKNYSDFIKEYISTFEDANKREFPYTSVTYERGWFVFTNGNIVSVRYRHKDMVEMMDRLKRRAARKNKGAV